MDVGVTLRLERLEQRSAAGEFIRLQTANLPPKAESGRPAEPLGVRSIGHSSIFVYDADLSAIALQVASNGISSTRVGLYVRSLVNTAPDTFLPVLTADVWQKLKTGRIRGLRVRVNSPDSLQSVDDKARSVKDGIRRLRDAMGAKTIDVTLSVGRGDHDIDHETGFSVARWLTRERAQERGGITALSAGVIPEGARATEWLPLLEAQMGTKKKLDLPDDDPDKSYWGRLAFARGVLDEHRAVIAEQSG